jgi:2-oxoglutarate ferredoxin oxidoreductase subunit delta
MAEVTIKKDLCKGCQLCIVYCPVGHLALSLQLNKRGVRFAQIKERTHCTGCGYCFLMCPDTCISVIAENKQKKEIKK